MHAGWLFCQRGTLAIGEDILVDQLITQMGKKNGPVSSTGCNSAAALSTQLRPRHCSLNDLKPQNEIALYLRS